MPLLMEDRTETVGKPADRDAQTARAAFERDVIEHFAEISRALGQPRSLAEIYGLLFISPQPMTMDDLIGRLQISKGSVSQGLRFLRDIGAVREVEVTGDRRTHYEAVAELRRLAGRFLSEQLAPRVAGNEKRLARLVERLNELPETGRQHAESRVTMLQSWHKNTRRILPLVIRILGQ
jgi:HTH-type transcriptional regulator, glycine betaine synthesis regulator